MIAGILDRRSTGIAAYASTLRAALAKVGVAYSLSERSLPGVPAHFHLGNSTRAVIPDVIRRRDPYAVTLHDVSPRLRALRRPYRLLLPALLARAGGVVVHSTHAADMLAAEMSGLRGRLAVIPHSAPAPPHSSRSLAYQTLATGSLAELRPDGPPLFVLPGTLKRAKLVTETIAAARPFIAAGQMRLLLSGAVTDSRLREAAAAAGVMMLESPDQSAYISAIIAADVVICVRADSVGESNGPLLDAIGAGHPSIVTAVGSAVEVAGDSAIVVAPTAKGLRQGIMTFLQAGERDQRAAIAVRVADRFSTDRVAAQHRLLFTELGWDTA